MEEFGGLLYGVSPTLACQVKTDKDVEGQEGGDQQMIL